MEAIIEPMQKAFHRRVWILILFALAACQALPQAAAPFTPALPVPTAAAAHSTPQILSPSPTVLPPLPPTASFSPLLPSETQSPSQTPAPGAALQARWHPDGPLYVGDQLSLEVIAPAEMDLAGKNLQVSLELPAGLQTLGNAVFGPFGLGERQQATLWWFWDTAGLQPGLHHLEFSVLPDGPTWQQEVRLLPAAEMPASEAGARWATTESQCCRLYYIRGTAAERDIAQLMAMADEQTQDVSQKLGIQPDEKIPVVLLPCVLGHGGFTAGEIAISYLDRNYAGSGSALVLHHELVHWLDGKLGGDLRPSLLVEGLAVYLTGGHFKTEPLMGRAAALLPAPPGCIPVSQSAQANPIDGQSASDAPPCSLDRFIPLTQLADNFYPSQHEIGYLEAGALIEYMVNTWGWAAFTEFYRDIHPQNQPTGLPDGTPTVLQSTPAAPQAQVAGAQASAIDAALQKHFQIRLEDLEQAFIAALRQEPLSSAAIEDVQLSVDYFDALRRYQQTLDPSAYFLYAWLADSIEMRQKGIVADYLRHPASPANLALEMMFVQADAALRSADPAQTRQLITAINAVLDRIVAGDPQAFLADGRALDYYTLALAVQAAGYQPQRAEINQNKARVWASASGPELIELQLQRSPRGWQILQTASAQRMIGKLVFIKKEGVATPSFFINTFCETMD